MAMRYLGGNIALLWDLEIYGLDGEFFIRFKPLFDSEPIWYRGEHVINSVFLEGRHQHRIKNEQIARDRKYEPVDDPKLLPMRIYDDDGLIILRH